MELMGNEDRRSDRADSRKESIMKIVKLSATNCYLLRCDGGYLQIDCGFPEEYNAYVRKLERLGVDPSEIKYLLLTHHHDDHAGFAAKLLRKTGGRLIVSDKALPFLARGVFEGRGKPLNFRVRVILGTFSFFRKRVFSPVRPRPGDFIVAGDDHGLLRSIGIDGDILSTPGHTSDSITVVISNGDAFVGDAAMNFLKICTIHYHPIFITDIDRVYKSWEKIERYGARVIYPSHGKPFGVEKLVVKR
jgi:hydroxyacylglutathione hydrolase